MAPKRVDVSPVGRPCGTCGASQKNASVASAEARVECTRRTLVRKVVGAFVGAGSMEVGQFYGWSSVQVGWCTCFA